MVEYHDATLDATFCALGDRTRRAILARLRQADATVTELARPFNVSLNAVSKHVKALERAGLVKREIRGREHHVSLRAAPLHRAARWMEGYRVFWDRRLDALDALLRTRRAAAGKARPR
ncbi:MAG: winged helix-turn-helix transcriptional regulator [Candidatus Rokubacteria bacterium]|nr:winged helix-turn-helix transcriptional regulator [Candidatus Rokubacteria bacterium]